MKTIDDSLNPIANALELVFALITADYTFQNTDPDDNFMPIIETPSSTL